MAISVEALEEQLSDVEVPILKGRGENGNTPASAEASAREIFKNYRDVIPASLRAKLGAKTATGDRSKVLWRLECRLLECGLTPGEVVALIEGTVWNKFADDRSRLWADVSKAAQSAPKKKARAQASSPNGTTQDGRASRQSPWAVPLERYLAVESRDPKWMVEGLWSDKSHGIIAGEPKTRKSYFAIDMALSVATRTPVFGHFPVKRAGSVLMIQEEVSDAEMRKRLRFIAAAKDLGGRVEKDGDSISLRLPEPVPFWLRNRAGFALDKDESYIELEKEVIDRGIKLIILDPIQMMLGSIDENQASQVRPVLKNLLQLKEATGAGVMLVHHQGKMQTNSTRKGGQRLLGSQAFHAWVESALYLSLPEPLVTRAEREFRNFEPMPHFDVEYMGGNEAYSVSVNEPKPRKPMTKFEKWCVNHPNTPVKDLAAKLKVSDKRIVRAIERSQYLEVKPLKINPTGRPVNVVTRLKVKG